MLTLCNADINFIYHTIFLTKLCIYKHSTSIHESGQQTHIRMFTFGIGYIFNEMASIYLFIGLHNVKT